MELLLKSFADATELIKATETINALSKNFSAHKISLTAATRRNIRTVGTSRYGLVRIVDKLATQYNNKLSKEDNARDLTDRMLYLDLVRKYKIAVMNLLESLDDTDKAVGRDVMSYTDKFSDGLKGARQHDGDVDEAMKELDEYNSRFGAAMEEEDKAGTPPDTTTAPAPLT